MMSQVYKRPLIFVSLAGILCYFRLEITLGEQVIAISHFAFCPLWSHAPPDAVFISVILLKQCARIHACILNDLLIPVDVWLLGCIHLQIQLSAQLYHSAALCVCRV